MLAQLCSGLPSTVPGRNWHLLRAARAASSKRAKPDDFITSDCNTCPSVPIRKRKLTVPSSSKRREAEGYCGLGQFPPGATDAPTRTGALLAGAAAGGGGVGGAGGALMLCGVGGALGVVGTGGVGVLGAGVGAGVGGVIEGVGASAISIASTVSCVTCTTCCAKPETMAHSNNACSTNTSPMLMSWLRGVRCCCA